MDSWSSSSSRIDEDLRAAAEALSEFGLTLTWVRKHDDVDRQDGEAHIEGRGIHWGRSFAYRSQLRPSTLGMLRVLEPGSLVVSEYITRGVGDLLRERELNYLDAAGNASILGPGVIVMIEGRPRETPPGQRGSTTLFTPAASPVVMALLNRPQLIHASLRDIQARVDVSLGTVQKVVDTLRRDGYDQTDWTRRANRDRWRRLLEGWVSAYVSGLRSKAMIGRYSTELPTGVVMERLANLPAIVSGEAAASVLGYPIKPATVDLYIYPDHGPAELMKQLRLRPNPDGWITLRLASWKHRLEADTPRQTLVPVAPAPVVYADLVAAGDPRLDDVSRELVTNDPHLRSFFD